MLLDWEPLKNVTFFDALAFILGAPGHEVHACGGEEEGAGFVLMLGLSFSTSTLCWGDKRKEFTSGGQNVSMNFCCCVIKYH